MTRTIGLGLAFFALAASVGCRSANKSGGTSSTDEQERRDRALSGVYQDDRSIGPRMNSFQPDPVGIGTASPRNGGNTNNPTGVVLRY